MSAKKKLLKMANTPTEYTPLIMRR